MGAAQKMAQPVLVSAYPAGGRRAVHSRAPGSNAILNTSALPPLSAFAFTDILRSADCPEFQTAINGIADLYTKSRLSLADEYGSHMPPLGEITAATPARMRPHLFRPGFRRALTSVPEGSSGSSEGSRRSLKQRKGGLFSFRKPKLHEAKPARSIRIGSMGRTVVASTTTALAAEVWTNAGPITSRPGSQSVAQYQEHYQSSLDRALTSGAIESLQQLLAASRQDQDG